MRTNYVVGGYVCMMILPVFRNNEGLFPNWISHILWIGTVFCFTKLAFPSETAIRKTLEKRYLNSPKPLATKIRAVLGTIEISRGRCRESFESVTDWKQENFNASWDHPTAIAILGEFSRILNKHLEDFPDERWESEVQGWIRFVEQVRRDQN